MITWLHNFEPSSILVNLGVFEIHWYGFLMTLAVIIGFVIASFLFKQNSISKNHLIDLGFYLVIFGLLGARLAHVMVELPYYIENPGQILAFWNGGLAIHGAIVVGLLIVIFYIKKYRQSVFPEVHTLRVKFFKLADILVVPLVLGQAIGRWGNYFNQELYGQPTNLPWGIPINVINRVPGFESFTHFHPTFLYESLACLILFVILFFLLKKRSQIKVAFIKLPGVIFSLYLLVYSLIRILIEQLRIDPQVIILNLRISVVASGLLIVVALRLMWYIYSQKMRKI